MKKKLLFIMLSFSFIFSALTPTVGTIVKAASNEICSTRKMYSKITSTLLDITKGTILNQFPPVATLFWNSFDIEEK